MPELTADRVEVAAEDEALEEIYRRGWTDGLPVVVPTEGRVERLLAASGRDPAELLGRVPPRLGLATLEAIAINCVMAGCRPEYLPVVVAALRAMLEPEFNLNGVQTTTHCVAPLAIVGGPLVEELGFHCGDGVFGGGSRASATVGRALRLILWNIGGAHAGELDRATLGHPGKYTYCIAENQAANPWEPLHVDRGLRPEQSAVTVFGCEAPHHVRTGPAGTGVIALTYLSHSMATLGNNTMANGGQVLVVLGPRAAAVLGGEGWSKDDIRQFLFENARKPVGLLKRVHAPDGDVERLKTAVRWPSWVNPHDDDALFPLLRRPEELLIAVAGGWGAGLAFSAVCPGWGDLGGHPVTRPIE